ncbi:conserved hypothetical protein [Thioalkalivibrio sp. K90mix]|jgi:hypothetical protein|uniref:hypothetical protein n=1 Tax=unclassified Thioalkalivibrio TaxID=2621013 RepID=UPI000195A8A8|nr:MULTISPECIES: hypothetical protein [unclassified Thioalkalivibrio]ADC71967.1 conserved hypothetical protein [Thioalkalivibrio sp. K90mix]
MEFFRTLPLRASTDSLQAKLTVPALPRLCPAIDTLVEEAGPDAGVVYCLWGEFRVRRECINGGVRFSLPGCPNALAWTLTTGHPPTPEAVMLHLTINRQEHDPDFVESLEFFADSWLELTSLQPPHDGP